MPSRTYGGIWIGPVSACIAMVLLLAPPKALGAVTTFQTGQKVEVREGDAWSPAIILRQEGRKWFIHYEGADASTDEWVTADRLRPPDSGGAANAPAATRPAVGPEAKPAPAWANGDKIECKWGGLWSKASVTNKNGKWVLVTYDEGGRREWVEPWRLRKRGSTEDAIGYASPHRSMSSRGPVDSPPKEDPAAAPGAQGASAAGGTGGPASGGSAPAGVTSGGSPVESAKPPVDLDKIAPLTLVNRTSLREASLVAADAGAFVPDATPPVPASQASKPITLAGATGAHGEMTETLLLAPRANIALAVHVDGATPAKPAVTFERVDLVTGRQLSATKMPVPTAVCDLSPDGKSMLAHSTVPGKERLEVWNVTASEATHVVSFLPFDDQKGVDRNVQWARFIDAGHLAVLNPSGLLLALDLHGTALWSAKVDPNSVPEVSESGRYLALSTGEGVAIVDALNGRPLRLLAGSDLHGVTLRFKPDGRQLAAASHEMLLVWNLDTGELKHDITPSGCAGIAIHWAGDQFILLDGRALVGLEQRCVVWNYHRGGSYIHAPSASLAGRFWYVSKVEVRGQKPNLVSVELPDQKARQAASTIKVDVQLLAGPGTKLAVEVNLPADLQERVTASLKGKVTANGMVVDDAASLKLVAATESGATREMSYQNLAGPRFGPNAQPATTMSVAELVYTLSVVSDGKVMWTRKSITSPPPFLNLKKDQTVEQAVSEAMTPRAVFFESVKLPRTIARPIEPGSVGYSRLTAQGTIADH